jgi:predicted transcriptional regulator
LGGIKVKELETQQLDEKDLEFAETLANLGLKRNVAKILAYLKSAEEVTSRDLEIVSDLRQPEVSIAMRELKNLNWISEREEKKPGKGRPYKVYKLKTKTGSIIAFLEEQKKRESQKIMANIKKLKELASA